MRLSIQAVNQINAIKDRDAKVYAAAKMYIESGYHVLPIRPNGKAIPGKSYNFNYSHPSMKPKTIDAWFGPNGKFEGWNIGFACGKKGGVFVADLDNHGDIDGIESFNELAPDDFTFEGPVAKTAGGGRHLLFEWQPGGGSSTSKVGQGIDTRGGTEEEFKGHIVVWPSIVDGNEYSWEQGGEPPPPPQWLMERMGQPWQRKSGGNRGNEELTDLDIEQRFTLDTISMMLDAIDPSSLAYNEWLEVGQAIHSQHPTDEALTLWDAWSQDGDRYERGECHTRWSGFKGNGAIRIGTLIFYAKRGGYELGAVDVIDPNQDQIDVLVAEMNKEFAVVPVGTDMMILQECDVPDQLARIKPKHNLMKRLTFKNLMENKKVPALDERGRPLKLTHADVWLAHEDRRTYPSGMGMFPKQEQRYQGYFNLWQGFAIESEPGDWSLFKWHIRDIICNGDGDIYEWVLDWMADLVQDPANPKGCAIVMGGIEGCGKGTFAQFIGDIFGTSFKHLTDEEHLVGRFNGHMADAVVVFADEVTYGGNKRIAGKLKALVTERYITAERKGVDAVQYHNCAHLLVASNEQWFIPAGPQSRRWCVLDVSGDKANDRKYFDAIHRQMEHEGGLGAMLEDLQKREITMDLKKAPETEALYDQRAQYAATGSVEAWWSRQLSRGIMEAPSFDAEESKDWPDRVAKNDMLDAYVAWCKDHNRKTVADNAFFKQILSFGLEIRRYRKPGGGRVYGYLVPNHDLALEIARKVAGIDLTIKGVVVDED